MAADDRQNPSGTEEQAPSASGNGNGPEPSAAPSTTTWTEPSYTESGEPASEPASVDTAIAPVEESYADPYTGVRYEANVEPAAPAAPPPPPPAAGDSESSGDEEDDEMLRMSFLEHLEELRSRIIRALAGLLVAFVVAMIFREQLWDLVQRPAAAALASLGYGQRKLVFTSPVEAFTIIWTKLPLLVSLFLASPWVLYQVWAFVSPGLYKRERRYAVPFIVVSAGLFILGGLFAYFVAFRFGLAFLLGVGQGYAEPMVTMAHYFDIFVNIILGVGVVFELPVLIFFLTLLRITSPSWLLSNTRYAVLAIVILAAVITPTPDVFNLMIFSVPMVLLFFLGVFASYLLVLSREGRRMPWRYVLLVFLAAVLVAAGVVALAIYRYGYQITGTWPYIAH